MTQPRKGTKIQPAEVAQLDPAKMGVMIIKPMEQEVEGQYRFHGHTECPWCGQHGHAILDSDHYIWFTCGSCGLPFRA